MNTNWSIHTHGDPLASLQDFVMQVWQKAELDAMLVSREGQTQPFMLEDRQALGQVNPFRPVMGANAAKVVPGLLKERPDARLGLLLRPCETRALASKARLEGFATERLLVICTDCLGTYPLEDFEWRRARKGCAEKLTEETLKFARQGGIAPYRYRPACQLCTEPDARGGDINIGVIGLPIRKEFLVSVDDPQMSLELDVEHLCDGVFDPQLWAQRERTLGKLIQRRAHTRERILQELSESMPETLDDLVQQLESCGDCRACLDSCPLCSAEFPQRSREGSYDRLNVLQWLLACAGCGMCEQACPRHLPIRTIFAYIRARLDEMPAPEPGYAL